MKKAFFCPREGGTKTTQSHISENIPAATTIPTGSGS